MNIFNQRNQLMTEGNIIGMIIRFSIPLLIGNLLQQSYQIVDMIIVGRCIDDDGLSIAAVGMSGPFILLMIGFFFGLSTGASIEISNAYGAGRMKQVKKSVKLSMQLAAGIAVAVCLISVLCCDWLLTVMNTTEDIFDIAAGYLKIYSIGFIPMLVYNMGSSVLQALGNSTSPFCYLAMTCVLNIFLDILFMNCFGMGASGAAAATVLSQLAAMAAVLWKLFGTDIFGGMKVDPEEEDMKSRQILGMIVRFGFPVAFQQVTITLANLILQGHINLLGTQTIAAWGIYGRIDGFLLMPLNSFSLAMTTFTGQNYGAHKYDRILKAKRSVCVISVSATLILCGAALLLCEPIVRIFEDTPEIVALTKEMCAHLLPFYSLLAYQRVYTGMYNGLGKTMYSSAPMIVCLCAVRVICITVAYPVFQSAAAIYAAYYVSWISCLLVILMEYFLSVRKEIMPCRAERKG